MSGSGKKGNVLVTGGTKRIGKAIADGLERAGWRVARSSHRADAGADLVADLSREGAADGLFKAATDLFGAPPDAIVNNAALFTGEDAELEMVNLAAPLRLAELLAECREGGTVVNILDCRVLRGGFAAEDAYGRTKLELLRATMRPTVRIRVNGVAPGPVFAPEGVHEKAGTCPFGRPAPEAVADAVAYLLSAQYTSGCVIPVDGGQSVIPLARYP